MTGDTEGGIGLVDFGDGAVSITTDTMGLVPDIGCGVGGVELCHAVAWVTSVDTEALTCCARSGGGTEAVSTGETTMIHAPIIHREWKGDRGGNKDVVRQSLLTLVILI